MINARTLDELAARVRAAAPKELAHLGEDIRQNVRATLAQAVERMELVTREEFDTQAAMLQRTRERLESLEALVAGLESRIEELEATGEVPKRS